MKKCIYLILCLALFSCASKKSKDIGENSQINLEVTKFTLDNGLKVLVYENDRLPIFSYYSFFDVGGRYEKKGLTGATHFLEHLMFKGAKKYGPGEFDTAIEANGGSTNAYTTFDSTVYYEKLPSHMLEKIIDMEADRLDNLLLEPVAFEKERAVVLEERKMRYENSPKGKIYLKMMQAIFENTPYGLSVIGSAEDVKSLTRDDISSFFKKFYAPNNAIIVIAGDVDADDVKDYIKTYYGPIKSNPKIKEEKLKMDDPAKFFHKARYKRDIHLWGTNPNPIFRLAFKGEPLGTRRGQVMDMLSSIIGEGDSSYLSQKYIHSKNPRLTNIFAYNYTLKNNGIFYVGGELLPKKGIQATKKLLLKDLANSCEKSITERTLEKTKNQYLKSYIDAIQTNSGVAHFLGQNENFYGDYSYYKKEMDIYNSITIEEVKTECNKLFKENEYIFLTIWNKNKK